MGRWIREELEEAFEKFQAAALKGAQSGDWQDWSNCFTRDATYIEHHYGRFWGRENIHNFITRVMKPFPVCHMTAFPVTWYSIDEDKGWVIFQVMNRMEDLGDGKIYEEPNITILHYAGNGLFKYEEDIYNPAPMGEMIQRWIKAKKASEKKKKS